MSETYAVCKKCKLGKFHIKIKVEKEYSSKPNSSNPTPVQNTKRTAQVLCDNCKTLYLELQQV